MTPSTHKFYPEQQRAPLGQPQSSSSACPDFNGTSKPRNAYFAGKTLAIVLCPGPKDKSLFAVTIDLEDLDRVIEFGFWRAIIANRKTHNAAVYCRCSVLGRRVYLHRFITGAPSGTFVDHTNHRTLDHRKSELHVGTSADNMINRRWKKGPGKSGYRGVRMRSSGRYEARARSNYGEKTLGTFDTAEEAWEAVKAELSSRGARWAASEQPRRKDTVCVAN